jgi:hypothetical protein
MPPERLYKVSAPRAEMEFHPSPFWRSADWESSTTRPRADYIRECVLYAGDFDEINIHLFPRVRTIRVRAVDADASRLRGLGLGCTPGRTSYIFVAQSRRQQVESFRPTIFTFAASGFTRVRKGEYVSWEPRRAISSETVSLPDAIVRWNIEACYVADLDELKALLSRDAIYFDEQT